MTGKKLALLQIEEFKLLPGEEWQESQGSWRFIRLHSGAAYWLGDGKTRGIAEKESLIAGPQAKGSLLASQLGPVVFHAFCFVPDLLWGVLTVAERYYFHSEAMRDKGAEIQFFNADHPISTQFAALIITRGERSPLLQRLSVLSLSLENFADDMNGVRPPSRGASAHERFEQVVHRIADTELLEHTPEEMARMCGCSPRHFNRLFRKEFGDSVRARQTELRLIKAKTMLAASDGKIIDVAHNCGYRNLSLFNTLFKKNFSMTPSEWRRKATKKAVKLSLSISLLLATGSAFSADTNAPTKPAKPGQAFEVKGYQLIGNTLLEPSVTASIFRDRMGPGVTFDSIREGLVDLQNAYRVRGFATVAVALPQQQITNGVVKIQITEGRLAEIRVMNNHYFSSNNIMREFPGLKTNVLLNSLVFQQQLDRANLNRDRQIYPSIGPGGEPGTTDLELKVKDRLPLHAHLEVNNNNTPYTPDVRLDVAAQYNNLWQLNHQLGVQYSFSPEEYKDGSFPFYERPLIANYSAFYRFPFANTEVQNSYQSIGNFGYDEATKRFRPPPASSVTEMIIYASRSSSDTGQRLSTRTLTPETVPPEGALQVSDDLFARTINPTENLGLRVMKPLPEFYGIESSFSAGLDYKNYRADVTQTKVFAATIFVPEFGSSGPPFIEFPSPPIVTSRELESQTSYLPFSLSWSASRKDSGGGTQLDLGVTFQPANILSSAEEFENAALDRRANGKFVVVTAGLTREQKIWKDWGIRFHADGQWANQPLLSTEQYALGGLAGVRGYHEGEVYGDRGWRFLFEPHSPYIDIGKIDNRLPVLVRLFAFFDVGERYLIGNGLTLEPVPTVQEKSTMLMGSGVGFSGTAGEHCEFRLQVGVPLKSSPRQPPFNKPDIRGGDPRIAFAFGLNF